MLNCSYKLNLADFEGVLESFSGVEGKHLRVTAKQLVERLKSMFYP